MFKIKKSQNQLKYAFFVPSDIIKEQKWWLKWSVHNLKIYILIAHMFFECFYLYIVYREKYSVIYVESTSNI